MFLTLYRETAESFFHYSFIHHPVAVFREALFKQNNKIPNKNNCSGYAHDTRWSYDGVIGKSPSEWSGVCRTGKRQSPIDIYPSKTVIDTNR